MGWAVAEYWGICRASFVNGAAGRGRTADRRRPAELLQVASSGLNHQCGTLAREAHFDARVSRGIFVAEQRRIMP